jgi:hypothetical protein
MSCSQIFIASVTYWVTLLWLQFDLKCPIIAIMSLVHFLAFDNPRFSGGTEAVSPFEKPNFSGN